MRKRIPDLTKVSETVIHASLPTDRIIGTGSGDPQKFDPRSTRETLDHSVMYIFAVALEDGTWHHDDSYLPERAARPSTVALWHRIRTVEDQKWTARYYARDPRRKAFGGRVVVTMEDGSRIEDEIALADAHPLGARPFGRDDYIAKFTALASKFADGKERERFLAAALDLPKLPAGRLVDLTVEVPPAARHCEGLQPGLFERSAV
jgi:2-methylcitrate dehydratase